LDLCRAASSRPERLIIPPDFDRKIAGNESFLAFETRLQLIRREGGDQLWPQSFGTHGRSSGSPKDVVLGKEGKDGVNVATLEGRLPRGIEGVYLGIGIRHNARSCGRGVAGRCSRACRLHRAKLRAVGGAAFAYAKGVTTRRVSFNPMLGDSLALQWPKLDHMRDLIRGSLENMCNTLARYRRSTNHWQCAYASQRKSQPGVLRNLWLLRRVTSSRWNIEAKRVDGAPVQQLCAQR
jgi:hypothetical protein